MYILLCRSHKENTDINITHKTIETNHDHVTWLQVSESTRFDGHRGQPATRLDGIDQAAVDKLVRMVVLSYPFQFDCCQFTPISSLLAMLIIAMLNDTKCSNCIVL